MRFLFISSLLPCYLLSFGMGVVCLALVQVIGRLNPFPV